MHAQGMAAPGLPQSLSLGMSLNGPWSGSSAAVGSTQCALARIHERMHTCTHSRTCMDLARLVIIPPPPPPPHPHHHPPPPRRLQDLDHSLVDYDDADAMRRRDACLRWRMHWLRNHAR